MNVMLNERPRLTIESFAEEHDLTMEIDEREPGRYYAAFKGCELRIGQGLSRSGGEGTCPASAIAAYTRMIRGSTLVFGAHASKRVEIDVPDLKVTFVLI